MRGHPVHCMARNRVQDPDRRFFVVANAGDVLDTMIGGDAPSGNTEEASKILEQASTRDSEGDRDGAIQMLRKAAMTNGRPEVVFPPRLPAGSRRGKRMSRSATTRKLTQLDRPHINALLNLAVIFEDQGNISRAEKCIRQVLDTWPVPRACPPLHEGHPGIS